MSITPEERERQVHAGDPDSSAIHRVLESFAGKFLLYVATILAVNVVLSLFWPNRMSLATFVSLSGLVGCMGHIGNFWNLYVNYEGSDVPHVWIVCVGLATLMYFHPC